MLNHTTGVMFAFCFPDYLCKSEKCSTELPNKHTAKHEPLKVTNGVTAVMILCVFIKNYGS